VHGRARSHEYDALHDRCIVFVGGEYWLVSDRLQSASEHCYDLLFHLDGQANKRTRIVRTASGLTVHSPNLLLGLAAGKEVSASLEDGFVSQSYGSKQPAPILRFTQHACNGQFHSILFPFESTCPLLTVEAVPVDCRSLAEPPSAVGISARRAGRLTRDIIFMAYGRVPCRSQFDGFSYDGRYFAARFEDGRGPRILHSDPGATVEYNGSIVMPERGQ
jgi:hypothetical protein